MFEPKALSHYRKLRDLTQTALAHKITVEYGDSMDSGQISDYERGLHTPGATRLRNIAKALDISTDQLFELPAAAL